jgi:polyisoprenoid-binding protein YceI
VQKYREARAARATLPGLSHWDRQFGFRNKKQNLPFESNPLPLSSTQSEGEPLLMAQSGVGVGAVQYAIDKRASQFTIQAFASGLISVVAHSPKIAVRDWEGEVQFVPDSVEDAHVSIRAKTGSLEVLDIERFPEFTFESSAIEAKRQKESLFQCSLKGRLTLHGISNHQSFAAQVAFGVDSFRAYGEFTVLQTDYGITVAQIAGGTLKLQDELKCSFYVIGRKKSQA